MAALRGSQSLIPLSLPSPLLLPGFLPAWNLNENEVTTFLGMQAALYLNKIDEQIHQRKLTLGKNTQVTLRAKRESICYLISLS